MKQAAKNKETREDLLTRRFGPAGKIRSLKGGTACFTTEAEKSYNAIELPVPKDMTPEMVALIALAHATDPTAFDFNKPMTSSNSPSQQFDMVGWNRSYIYTSIVPGDARSLDFSDVMANSRLKTKETLENYIKTGDIHPLKKVMKEFAGLVQQKMLDIIPSSGLTSNEKQYFQILTELNEKVPALGIREMFTDASWAKINSLKAQIEGSDHFYGTASQLMNEMPAAGSAARKQLAFDLLVDAGIMSADDGLSTPEIYAVQNKLYQEVADQLSELGADQQYTANMIESKLQDLTDDAHNPDEASRIFFNSISFAPSLQLAETVLPVETFSPEQAILSEKDGRTKLAAAYKKAITSSKLYKDLVKESDPEKLKSLIQEAQKQDFTKYPAVTLDDTMAKKLGSDHTQSERIIEKWRGGLQHAFAHLIGPKKMERALGGLKPKDPQDDSPALLELRTKTQQLHDLMQTKGASVAQDLSKADKLMQDPEIKTALLEAYQASVAYQFAVREQANVPEDTLQWRPADPAHAARFDTAVEIEQYARQFIDIEVLRAAAERDEKAREDERIKAAQKAQLEHTYDANSVGGKCVQAAIDKVKADVRVLVEAYAKTAPNFKGVPADLTADDLAVIPIKEAPLKDLFQTYFARVIAARTVADASERAAKDGMPMNEKEAKRFVDELTEEIKTRPDLKTMVAETPFKDLYAAATESGGKGLMMKLAEASRKVDAREHEAEQRSKTATKNVAPDPLKK